MKSPYRKHRLSRLLFAVICLVATWSSAAQACKCIEKPPLTKEMYDHYNLIFVGKAGEEEKPGFVSIESLYEIKGKAQKSYVINFAWSIMCGSGKPAPEQIYLIFAFMSESQTMSGGCGGVTLLSDSEIDLVKLLQFKEGETS